MLSSSRPQFLFSQEDQGFRDWLFQGISKISEASEPFVSQEVFFDELRNGEFNGIQLSFEQRYYLRSLFPRNRILLNSPQDFIDHSSFQSQFARLRSLVDQFFEACKRDYPLENTGMISQVGNYLSARVFDTGTDEKSITILLRSIQNPQEMQDFLSLVSLDLRLRGESFETFISSELSGRELSRVQALIQDKLKRDEDYLMESPYQLPQSKARLEEYRRSLQDTLAQQRTDHHDKDSAGLTVLGLRDLTRDKNAVELTLLMQAQEASKLMKDFEFYQKHYELLECFRDDVEVESFQKAYTLFQRTHKKALREIECQGHLNSETYQDLLKTMIQSKRELAIFKGQEILGSDLLMQDLQVGKEVFHTVFESSMALGAGAFVLSTGGLGASILVGGSFATLTGTGLRLGSDSLEGKSGNLTEHLHRSATNGFATSTGLGIGAGIRHGTKYLIARDLGLYGAKTTQFNLLGRTLQSTYTHQVIINQSMGATHALLRADSNYGFDEMAIYGVSGLLGGYLDKNISQGFKSLSAEALREGGEELAEAQFSLEKGDVSPQNLMVAIGGAFTEIAPGASKYSAVHSHNFFHQTSSAIPDFHFAKFDSYRSPLAWQMSVGPIFASMYSESFNLSTLILLGVTSMILSMQIRRGNKRTVDQNLSELRSVLNEEPSTENWEKVKGLIEEAKVLGSLKVVLDYASQHLKIWPDDFFELVVKNIDDLLVLESRPAYLPLIRYLEIRYPKKTFYEKTLSFLRLKKDPEIDLHELNRLDPFINLKSLAIYNGNLTVSQRGAFHSMNGLRLLALSSSSISESGIRNLVASDNLKSLDTLVVEKCGLDDRGMTWIAGAPQLSQVSTLILNSNRLTDEGAIALVQSPYLRHLTNLALYGNRLEYPGALAIVESPHFRNLRHVELNFRNHQGYLRGFRITSSQPINLEEAFNHLMNY